MSAIASTAGANQRTEVLILIEQFISASSQSPGSGKIPLNWHSFKNNAPVVSKPDANRNAAISCAPAAPHAAARSDVQSLGAGALFLAPNPLDKATVLCRAISCRTCNSHQTERCYP